MSKIKSKYESSKIAAKTKPSYKIDKVNKLNENVQKLITKMSKTKEEFLSKEKSHENFEIKINIKFK